MKHKIIKSILAIAILTISPFIVLTIIGSIYVLFMMTQGVSFTAGVQLFINLIANLKPYLPYLTTLPILLGLTVSLFKNRDSLKRLLNKR